MRVLRLAVVAGLLMLVIQQSAGAQQIIIGSKPFTESYVLGEIAKKMLQDAKFDVQHKQGMGKTIIIWAALKTGAITLYPEYTGTISEEILKAKKAMTPEAMRAALAPYGVGMTGELGFNNTYAITMNRAKAQQLGISKISDLKNHPELKVGVTHEFLKRADGWEPLSTRYGLNMASVRGIEHALAYAALKSGDIDLTDAYSTDAKIAEYDLVVLEDDLRFFPQYKAVFLYRLNLDPRAVAALRTMEGTLDETRMTRLNAEAEKTKSYALAAASYFGTKARAEAPKHIKPFSSQLMEWVIRHLELVGISMLMAIIVGIPLGICAGRPGFLSQVILGTTGVIQTIPSLALLALLVPIPFLGISPATAIIALFLYSLLPIVRNTATGLQDIPTPLRESAAALGLEPRAQLTKVFLPMASRTILAGIKTSAVINVGTATLAALIGAGGLGEPIISGLNLVDHNMILQGAIPAAILALFVQFLFDLLDRLLIPQGLRLDTRRH
ncbi:MAG TPA: glycine betaine ABC transporter substrate-binding protein [Abditibacteriaceae bacterium]|nr:glycine betaine ABC transporter substrate-binding protein [Abditibacteriaceae bacterium]